MKVVTTTATNIGAQYNYNFIASTQYTLSLYAKVSSGSITDFVVGRQDVGSDINCLTGQTVNTAWTRFSCTFTTGATISGTPNIYVQKSGASAETFFIDGVQLETAAAATTYTEGNIKLDGQVTFKNSADSTTAFQVQNAAATNLFSIDTSGLKLQVGSSTTDATAVLLILDSYNTTDPTGVAGAMYYSTSTNSFRCYQNNVWVSCIGGLLTANTSIPGGNTVANTNTETNFASNYSLPANYCQPGRVIRVIAQGVFSTASGNPQITLKLKFGSTVIGASPTGALVGSLSNREWRMEYQITCDTTGASGTVEGQGIVFFFTAAAASNDEEMLNTGTVTVDTTSAQTLQLSWTWSTANVASTSTLRQLVVEGLGP
jgi:hypothetical protein